MTRKVLRTAKELAEPFGLVTQYTAKGHIRLVEPESGKTIAVLPGTTSDVRSIRNAQADLNRWARANKK